MQIAFIVRFNLLVAVVSVSQILHAVLVGIVVNLLDRRTRQRALTEIFHDQGPFALLVSRCQRGKIESTSLSLIELLSQRRWTRLLLIVCLESFRIIAAYLPSSKVG